MKRVYVSYDESSLRTFVASWKDDALSKLATLFNYRNHPSASDVSEVVVYRNTFGDLFEMRFKSDAVNVSAAAGGAFIVSVLVAPAIPIEAVLNTVESYTCDWSRGIVECGDCRTPMRRFSPDIVLAYHGGRYCATCAPKYERLAASEID